MIAFLYARVSTGEQDTGMQIRELLEYAKRRDWQTEVFTDSISGAKDRRPGLDQMMAQVRRRKCDVVLVYRYDRFARSLQQLVNALEEFRVLGVNFVSLHEGVDTSTPNGRLVFGIFALRLSVPHAAAHSVADQLTLKFSDRGVDAENKSTVGRAGVYTFM